MSQNLVVVENQSAVTRNEAVVRIMERMQEITSARLEFKPPKAVGNARR